MNRGMTAFGVKARRRSPLSPLPTIRSASSGNGLRSARASDVYASSAGSSSHSRSHRVSSFRGLPQSATARTQNCLDFG